MTQRRLLAIFGVVIVAVVAFGFVRGSRTQAPIIDNVVPPAWTPPTGFTLTSEPDVAYRWAEKGEFDCEIADRCWGMFVVPRDGCDRSLYVELSIIDDAGTAVGYTNDSAGAVQAGQQAKLVFDNFEKSATQARLARVSCL